MIMVKTEEEEEEEEEAAAAASIKPMIFMNMNLKHKAEFSEV
jgi:hypothetical protein